MTRSIIAFLFVLLAALAVHAMPPVSVVANVRGKKYDVTAETVDEFCQKVEELSGIEADAQSILFRGKVLNKTDKLEEMGVAAGDVLNVVKGRKAKQPNVAEVSPDFATDSKSSVGKSDIEDALSMGGEKKAQQEAMMNSMNNMLDNIEEYFSPEKLEESRLQLLEKIDEYEKVMPGFRAQAEEIAKDPQKWQEAMLKAKDQMLKLKEMRDSGGMDPNAMFPTPPGSPSDTSVDDIGEDDE